jgi:predicted dehydrogenase
MAPIKTCVCGVGLGGLTFHAPFILALPDLFVLHSVLERTPKSPGGALNARFGVAVSIKHSIEEVAADPEIEFVIITTPNEFHYSMAKAVLLAGKHVLIDKPVATTVEEANELGEIAKSKGLILTGFQNRRWDSDFLALKKLLGLPLTDPNSIGNMVEFESQ